MPRSLRSTGRTNLLNCGRKKFIEVLLSLLKIQVTATVCDTWLVKMEKALNVDKVILRERSFMHTFIQYNCSILLMLLLSYCA